MKKFIITLISIFLLLSAFTMGFFVKKSIEDKKTIGNTIQEEYKHPIDIEEEQCINNSNVYDYSLCGEKAEKAWDREIQKNTELLQKVMTKEEFKYIKNMNETWNKSLYNQQDIINRFISNKEGLIHQTDGQNNIIQIKKQYALLLKSIYYNYYEEDSEFKDY